MKKRLGISVYPDQATPESIKAYIKQAAKYGFERIFTCLISASGDPEVFLSHFKSMTECAAAHGMEVIADVDPGVFEIYKINPADLSFFKMLKLSGIRLDLGFSGHEEALMTHNPYGLTIELNMSSGNRYVENIMSYKPNVSRLYGCHNFYPHRFTGLSDAHFMTCSEQFKNLNLKTAAFINAPSATIGPWPVREGLCTLEKHRELSITTQAKDLFNTGLIDDVIIANMFASEAELKALGTMDREILTLNVKFLEGATATERKIVLEEPHYNRGDVSAYMIRSTMSRVKYKGHAFPPHDTDDIQSGDVIIESDLYTRYAGELQIALQAMPSSGRSNRVAVICEEEKPLIYTIKPWQSFRFTVSTEE